MIEIKKVRQTTGNFDVMIPEIVPEYYADGIHTALIGLPVCKLVFHRVTAMPSDEQLAESVEPREIAFRVAMPMAALLEFAKSVVASAEQNRSAMDSAFDAYKVHLDKALNSLSGIPIDKGDIKDGDGAKP